MREKQGAEMAGAKGVKHLKNMIFVVHAEEAGGHEKVLYFCVIRGF